MKIHDVLDKSTKTVDQLAKKYNVTVEYINQQLKRGTEVESEHTSHSKVAREIALDHLGERLDYYTQLTTVEQQPSVNNFIKKFAPWVAEQLGIKLPKIELLDKPIDTTFGQYNPETKSIKLVTGGRHPVDVLRTLAHELTHYKQDLEDNLPAGAGETGTDQENEANANAGITMRDFAQQNPDQFGLDEDTNNKCPPATQDITLNLKNRQKAIDEYGYGPLNPDMPNSKFWMKKVDEWNLDSAEEAKSSLCGNCAAFDVRHHTLDCIAQGIDSDSPQDAAGVINAGDLGYCKFLKFKCASRRTCDAWVTGGPLTDKLDATEGLTEEFDLIESIIDRLADRNRVDVEVIWEDLESLTDDELYVFAVTQKSVTEDWQKANKKDRTDGMSQKAVNAYRREHPGSKLKTAVTTKPSKLKKGSKASKRRKSYCSRSKGQMKMQNISCAKTPEKAICKARRRWNC